jgi:glycosyltransferase involved in cell wall biosynthesis
MNPRVSVIVPNRNMAAYIGFALDSIFAQNIDVHEVVCVDCASEDNSVAVITGHLYAKRIRLVHHSAVHPAAARNVALSHATGDVIAFLDADDLWPAGKLDRQLARLFAEPEVDMVSGYVCYFDTQSETGLEPAEGSRQERLFHVHLGACIYRRNFLDQIGGFDEALVYSEDVDLMLRVRESQRPFTILRSSELYYRRHAASMMAQPDPRREQSLKLAAHKSLLRRRAAGMLTTPLKDFSTYLEPL